MRGPGGHSLTSVDSARYDAAIWLVNDIRKRHKAKSGDWRDAWVQEARNALYEEFGVEGLEQAAAFSKAKGNTSQADAIIRSEAGRARARRADAIRHQVAEDARPKAGVGLGDFS